MKRRFVRPRTTDLLAYTAVFLVVGFAVYQWIYSGGFPYIRDGNETATSFVHALNLEHFNPFKLRFLTFSDTEFNKTEVNPVTVYTHNPNFPRYIHYALLCLGVKSFTIQVLLIILPVSILNIFALRWFLAELLGEDSLGRSAAIVAVYATVFDYLGFLSFTVNTYRTYVFCLLWLCLLSVIRPWKTWQIFAIFFVLFQLEYGFASFVLASALSIWAFESRPLRIRPALSALGGSVASAAFFILQLRSYESFSLIFRQFTETAKRRGTEHFGSNFFGTLEGAVSKIREINSPAQNVILAWALASSLAWMALSAFGRPSENSSTRTRVSLAGLYLSLIVGGLFASLLLSDYVLEAFFGSILPFLTFYNVVATTVVASDLFLLVGGKWIRQHRLAPILCILIGMLTLAPMVRQSIRWWRDYPGLTGGYIDILKKHYLGKPIVVMSHFPQLPTAITRGPTLQMTDDEPSVDKADFHWWDQFRDENGELVFLCLELRWVEMNKVVRRLQLLGDKVLYQGSDFAFVGLKRQLGPIDSVGDAVTGEAFGGVSLHVQFPTNRQGHLEPLLGCGRSENGNVVYVVYEDAAHIRVGIDAGERGGFLSPPILIDYAGEHDVEIVHGSLYPDEGRSRGANAPENLTESLRGHICIRLDDQTLIDAQLPLPPLPPSSIAAGEAHRGLPFSGDRLFTGRILSMRRFWPADLAHFGRDAGLRAADFGLLEGDLIFPPFHGPASEPLVTSGITGRADFLYVNYIDSTHARIGFDHWSTGGPAGPLFAIVPGKRYHAQISMGCLFPPKGDILLEKLPPDLVEVLKSRIRVVLDGDAVLEANAACYDSPPIELRFGENQIGGSTCGPRFTGRLMNLRRAWPPLSR